MDTDPLFPQRFCLFSLLLPKNGQDGGKLAFLFYQLYTLVLEHLERKERLKEMLDRG
jgi:hypothetical protein